MNDPAEFGIEHRHAFGAAKAAEQAVSGATSTLGTAITEAQNDARRLAPYAHRELLDLLRVPAGVGWPGTDADCTNRQCWR